MYERPADVIGRSDRPPLRTGHVLDRSVDTNLSHCCSRCIHIRLRHLQHMLARTSGAKPLSCRYEGCGCSAPLDLCCPAGSCFGIKPPIARERHLGLAATSGGTDFRSLVTRTF
jgi:hypothetical protein